MLRCRSFVGSTQTKSPSSVADLCVSVRLHVSVCDRYADVCDFPPPSDDAMSRWSESLSGCMTSSLEKWRHISILNQCSPVLANFDDDKETQCSWSCQPAAFAQAPAILQLSPASSTSYYYAYRPGKVRQTILSTSSSLAIAVSSKGSTRPTPCSGFHPASLDRLDISSHHGKSRSRAMSRNQGVKELPLYRVSLIHVCTSTRAARYHM